MPDGLNLDDASAFLAALTGEPDAVVCWQTTDDRKSGAVTPQHRHASLSYLGDWLVGVNHGLAGIHVAINATDGKGRKAANVTGLRALFVDSDDGCTLPDIWGLEPDIIASRTPTRWHAYWLLQPGEDPARFAAAQLQLAYFYLGDHGLTGIQGTMRCPGFLHCKADPMPLRLVRAERKELRSIDAILAAHPVDWATCEDPWRGVAIRLGIIAKPPEPVRPAAAPAASEDLAWYDDQFRAWAMAKDTAPGGANAYGGQDKTAFRLAMEGIGRHNDGHLSSDAVAREVVEAYLERCGWTRIAQEAQQKILSAKGRNPRGNAHHLTPPSRRRSGRPAADRKPAGPPSAGEDLFAYEPIVIEDEGAELVPAAGGAGGSHPPEDRPRAAAGDDAGKFGGIDLDALQPAWNVGPKGVCPWKKNADGDLVVNYGGRITDLPIWPEQQGTDAATGASWWKIGWLDNRGKTRNQWLADEAMRDGSDLIRLPDGPVTSAKFRKVADYLTCARRAVTKPTIEVLSRVGWVGINGGRRWVWPSDDANVQYIGPPLATHGDVEGWRTGVDALIAAGVEGYTALTAVCFSVASPFVRLASSRAPIYGLVCRSSSGKGSALDYAISVWAMPNELRVPASSTVKGLQDRAAGVPDLPIFIDELQQLVEAAPLQAGSALYYLANGQRRVTSSQKQIAVGGEARHGVAFYAAEAAVLPGQNTGVHYRCIESDLQPCPSAEVARILQHASEHYGVLAPQIAEMIRSRPPSAWQELIRTRAHAIQADFVGLKGGDAVAIALWRTGAEILGRLLDADWDYQAHQQWLIDRLLGQRAQTEARDIQALEAILTVVLKQHWTETDTAGKIEYKTEICLQGSPLAWSIWSSASTGGACEQVAVDLDPNHAAVADLFRSHGGEAVLLRLWRDRGWIETQGTHLKIMRRGKGRVIRFNSSALEHVQGKTSDIA